MHEISIAQALADLVEKKAPPAMTVHGLCVRAGAMRAIEPEALTWAWQAVTQGTRLDGSRLDLQILPWQVRCATCEKCWSDPEPSPTCACGSQNVYPVGTDELTLLSIRVEDEEDDEGET
jgi:hydrogenase nickel incorporation protein HypA/HybF